MRRLTLAAIAAIVVAIAAAAGAAGAAPAIAQTAKRTVGSELDRLLAQGAIDVAHRDEWLAAWSDANRTLRRLQGARRDNLRAVVTTTRRIAESGALTGTRAPAVFLTLQRNRDWWASRPLLANGARVSFPGSQLVWQAYAGQGIQIQWLGTFGKLNALLTTRTRDAELKLLIGEALQLAAARAGGIAWEYLFPFDGGNPPWVSSLAQGTAIQALAKAAVRFGDPTLFDAARRALGIFVTPPPEGVSVPTAIGAHYLQYSYGPRLFILNGFIQSLNGLHDLAVLSGDPQAAALFSAGEAQARAEVTADDTGAWSLYRPGFEADLHYHRLVIEFMRSLCQKLAADAQSGRPMPEPTFYCAAADRFAAYTRQPPVLTLEPPARPWRTGRDERLWLTLSKVSTVTFTLRRSGRTVYARTMRLTRGRQSLTVRPARPGVLDAELRAVDLAGNAAPAATASMPVQKASKPKARRKGK